MTVPEATTEAHTRLLPDALSVAPESALIQSILALKAQRAREAEVAARYDAMASRADRLSSALASKEAEVKQLSTELAAMRFSASWRFTLPLRLASSGLPWLAPLIRRVAGQARRYLDGIHRSAGMAPLTQSALGDSVVSRDETSTSPPTGMPLQTHALEIPFSWARPASPTQTRIAAAIHFDDAQFANEFRRYLDTVKEPVDIFITTTSDFQAGLISSAFADWKGGAVQVRASSDRESVLPLQLEIFKDFYSRYEYVLYLTGKRQTESDQFSPWRQFMLEGLIGDGDCAQSILTLMDELPEVGLVGLQHYEAIVDRLGWNGTFENCQVLASQMGFSLNRSLALDFPSGSMFWARSAALAPFFTLEMDSAGPSAAVVQCGPTMAHAAERLFYFACEHAGYRWMKVARRNFYMHTESIDKISDPSVLREKIRSDHSFFFNTSSVSPIVAASASASASASAPASAPASESGSESESAATVNPTPALVTQIQLGAMGRHDRFPASHRKKSVVVGIVADGNALKGISRAANAALKSIETAMPLCDGMLHVLTDSAATAAVLPVHGSVRQLDNQWKFNFLAGHNYLMAHAFENGATHYVVCAADRMLNPGAIRSMIGVMNANRDRALVDAAHFPRQDCKSHDVYDLTTPWLSRQCMMMSRTAYKAMGAFDGRLSESCAELDLSWRALAAGISVKTSPNALTLGPLSNGPKDVGNAATDYRSIHRLARKWGAPPAFERSLLARMQEGEVDLFAESEDKVPLDWCRYADFDGRFDFAKTRTGFRR